MLNLLFLAGGAIGLIALHVRFGSVLRAVEQSYAPTFLAVFSAVWGTVGTAHSLFGWPGFVVASLALVVPAVAGAVMSARRRHRAKHDTHPSRPCP